MRTFYIGLLGALLSLLIVSASEDLPISQVSGSSYHNWVKTGTAFSRGPVSGDALRPLEIENAAANPVISSETEGDGPIGTLTSPEFEISRNYIAFRIGGGDYERDTCLDLLIDGKVVKRATGWQSDHLIPETWDVKAFRGRNAKIQVVDQSTGDWGHINVAGIVQTDSPERIPVETGQLYREALRPQFHFTARQWTMNRLNPGMQQEGWINDLNGLIYYEGEYHLFAQRWAKCWLHAVSRDLVHWTELEPAFWEEHPGSGAQSGTCVIDYDNTSGLGTERAVPPMVAFFPRWDNNSQCIAYSLDHGRSWKYFKNNPVLVHHERDPNVFWHAPSKHWVMLLYGDQQYHILTSTNLLSWKDEHHPIKDSYECPDFFELPVDGDRNSKKWVLVQGNGNYSVGTFDGVEFKEETDRHPCDIGPNFYATQSWHNTETADGRRIQAAWMRGPNFPDMPFNQQVSFPCELTLRTTTNGLRLFRSPISEISLLHQTADNWTNRIVGANQELLLEPSGRLFHIKAELDIPNGAKAIFNVRGNRVILTSKSLESGGAPAMASRNINSFEMLVDVASIESFVNDGEVSSTRFVLPRENKLSLRAEGGPISLKSLTIYPLESAWSTSKSSPVK